MGGGRYPHFKSVWDSNGWYLAVLSQYEAVIDVIGSLGGIDALYIEKVAVEIWSGGTVALYRLTHLEW